MQNTGAISKKTLYFAIFCIFLRGVWYVWNGHDKKILICRRSFSAAIFALLKWSHFWLLCSLIIMYRGGGNFGPERFGPRKLGPKTRSGKFRSRKTRSRKARYVENSVSGEVGPGSIGPVVKWKIPSSIVTFVDVATENKVLLTGLG